MKQCPRCGSMCDDNHMYCDSCGFDFKVIGKTPAQNSDGTNPNTAFGIDTELSEEKQPPIQSEYQQDNQPPLQSTYQQDNQPPIQNSFQQNNQPPNQSTYQQPFQNTYQQNIQPRPQSTYNANDSDFRSSYRQSNYDQQQATVAHYNGMAIASLVLGLVGIVFVCCYFLGVIPAILAVILGAVANNSISISKGREKGSNMSVAGVILGIVTVTIAIILYILMLKGLFTFTHPSYYYHYKF